MIRVQNEIPSMTLITRHGVHILLLNSNIFHSVFKSAVFQLYCFQNDVCSMIFLNNFEMNAI